MLKKIITVDVSAHQPHTVWIQCGSATGRLDMGGGSVVGWVSLKVKVNRDDDWGCVHPYTR